MNAQELRAEIVRAGYNISTFAEKCGINKKSLYAKMNGKVSFKQDDIVKIKLALGLSDNDILRIFFAA